MPTLTPEQQAQLLLRLIARRTSAVIETDPDEARSLRKAILVLVALTQGSTNPAAEEFVQHLLTKFKPLTSHFKGSEHDLWDGHTIGLRRTEHNKRRLAVSRRLVGDLLRKFGKDPADVQDALVESILQDGADRGISPRNLP